MLYQFLQLSLFLSLIFHFIITTYSSTPVEIVLNLDRIGVYALQDAALAYKLVDSDVTIDLRYGLAVDSIQAVVDGTSDAGLLSITLPTNVALANPAINMFPLVAAAIVPVYRIDAIGSAVPLILSREALALIYMGEITWWNDTRITSTNPTLTLPQLGITLILAPETVCTVLLFKQAFDKFHPNFSKVVNISMVPDWPLQKYHSYSFAGGITGVGSAVIAQDGTIGMVVQSVALKLQINTASLINKAGNVVRASADSVTFAAVELGTSLSLTSTEAADLTDCSASSGWPISAFSYLLIDLAKSRGTCHARAALVEFFLNFYQSSTLASLLAIREYAPVPSIVMTQLDIINQFPTWVKCRGQPALPTQPTTTRTMSVPGEISFLSNLFASVYSDPQGEINWELDVNTDEINLERLLNSEVELAFINPANINQQLYQETLNDKDYLVLPAFAFAWSWVYNSALTPNINIKDKPLILDLHTISLIYHSCFHYWNDTNLLTLNPWLSDIIGNTSVPIEMIIACSTATNTVPGGNFILNEIKTYNQLNPDSDSAYCSGNYSYKNNFYTCTNVPSIGLQWTQNEAVSSSLVTGTNGGMGYMMANGDTSYELPLMRINKNGQYYDTQADINGIMACAYDTFNPLTKSFDLSNSRNTSCFPFTQQYVIIVRRQYYSDLAVTNTSACSRGLDTLQMLHWLFSNDLIDALTDSVNIGRLSNVPGVQQVYLDALNAALCDTETLLITLPITWELNSGIAGFGYAAAVIGFVLTSILMGFTIVYHRHPIIRAASPLFMSVSLFGVIMMFAGAVALVSPVSTFSCGAVSWLINLGIMVTFAPLFAKTWRIYRIFGRRKLSVVKISNRKLMFIIGTLLSMEIIILIIWQALSPLQPYITSTIEGSASRVHNYNQCGVEDVGTSMFAIVAVEKGLLLLFGALMAFSTRRVSSQFNESSQVALAIYNVVFSIGIIAPIIFVIGATGDVLVALLLFVLLWISFFTACILVIPKALHILSPQSADQTNTSIAASSGNSQSGYSFLSMDILSTVAVATGYLAALKNHVVGVEKHINKMKGGGKDKSLEKSLVSKRPSDSQQNGWEPHQPISRVASIAPMNNNNRQSANPSPMLKASFSATAPNIKHIRSVSTGSAITFAATQSMKADLADVDVASPTNQK